MKRLIILSLLCASTFGFAVAQQLASYTETKETIAEEQVWHTKLTDAHKISKETGKPIFAFFTGSDWCGWCFKLQAAVLKKPAFKEWAKENVVLLELDYPRRKKLEPELAKQNQELQQFFQVRGFPVVWVFNTELKKETNQFQISALGQAGYPRGGTPGKEEVVFIENMEKILAKGKTPPSDH